MLASLAQYADELVIVPKTIKIIDYLPHVL